jgi:DNA replication ATP-dependent helicase Dna2
MTFQAALTNLGKRRSAFTPQIVLFDEAGQIPLAHAAAVGQLGGGSVVFIGDDAQMPPIYHPKLESDPLSVSVFERIKALYPRCGRILNVTYRMNKRITRFVGDCFYRPRGIELECSEFSAKRHIDDPEIEFVECSSAGSTDENAVEARKAVDIANKYLDSGLPPDRLAIITPYRHQVRLVRKLLNESRQDCSDIPLVDTVERLQGQDVDVIILSFSVDDAVYFAAQEPFLMNRNRLNVMFSRATSKVVVVSSRLVQDEVKAIWTSAVKSRSGESRVPTSFRCGKSTLDA